MRERVSSRIPIIIEAKIRDWPELTVGELFFPKARARSKLIDSIRFD
jgi:hypothetical protein